MNRTIKCPGCETEIEISDAILKDIEVDILQEIEENHRKELKTLENEHLQKLEQNQKAFEKKRTKLIANAEKAAKEKIQNDYEAKIKAKDDEAKEREEKYKSSQDELIKLTKELRAAKDAESTIKLEFERKLIDEQAKIQTKARKEAEDEMSLQIAEKDKKLGDAEKQIRELQRKIQQGSQQTQGEVLELELEDELKQSFPFDEISEVPKGIKGADVIQIVKTKMGKKCGTIVWESKNTKNWSNTWIKKLIEDQRALKAELAILVSVALPDEIESFGQKDKIWVSNRNSAIPLVSALRNQLIEIKSARDISKGMATQAEVVYKYLTSNEFKQRIEIWVEYFKERQEEISKERAYFNKKWEKEEKEMQKVFDSTAGMYGDLQGLIGNALPKVQSLELPEEIE